MALNVGELYATLKLDSKKANEGLSKFGESAKKMGENISKAGGTLTKKLTLPIAGLALGMVAGIKKFGSFADSLLDLSAQTGITTDELQRMRQVEKDAGIEQDTLANSALFLTQGLLGVSGEAGKSAKILEKMGIETKNANGEFKSGDELQQEAIKTLADMTDKTERNALAQKLFGGDYKDMLVVIDAGGDAFEASKKKAEDLGLVLSEDTLNSANDARKGFNDMASVIENKLFASLDGLLPIFNDVLVPLFMDKVIPAIEGIIEKVGDVIQWFTDLDGGTQKLIGVFVGLLAGIGPLLSIVGPLISIIGTLSGAFGAVGLVIGAISAPVLIIIGILVALGVGIVALYKTNEEFRNKVKLLWENVKEFIKTTVDQIVVLFNAFVDLAKRIWEKHGADIMAVVSKAFDVISAVIKTAMDIIKNVIKIATGLIKGDWGQVWEGIKGLFKSIIDGIVSIVKTSFELIKTVISGVLEVIKGIFSTVWTKIKNTTSSLVNGIKNAISGAFTSAKNTVVSIASSIYSGVVNKFNSMKSKATSIINGLKNGIVGIFTRAKNSVVSIASSIYSGAIGKFNNLKNKVTGVFNGIKNTVTNSINGVKRIFSRLRLNFPKIKLPHFSIRGKFSIVPPRVPKLSIRWYQRGAVLDNPTIAGLAERGREAIVPLEGNAGNVFAQAFMDRLQSIGGGMGGVTNNISIVGYGGNPRQLAKEISREIQLETDRKTRARGR